jgi:phage portal protein BeeE
MGGRFSPSQRLVGVALPLVSLQAGFYVKFIDTELLRGAAADRAAYYATALGSGGSPAWMTPNEVRALEEMDAIDGGDELPAPTNLPAPPADAGASNGTP